MMNTPVDVFLGWQPLVRAEVVAALLVASVPAFLLQLAVVAPGPVHVGTDSMAFLLQAVAIVAYVADHDVPYKHWAVHNDGDLWAVFERAVRIKGAHAVAFKGIETNCVHKRRYWRKKHRES